MFLIACKRETTERFQRIHASKEGDTKELQRLHCFIHGKLLCSAGYIVMKTLPLARHAQVLCWPTRGSWKFSFGTPTERKYDCSCI